MFGSQAIQLNTVRRLPSCDLFADSKFCVKNYSCFNLDFMSDTIIIPFSLTALWPCMVYRALQFTSSPLQMRETN
jgi:hypothetical protein